MVNVHLTLGDVAATVFVVSPVQEAVFSLRAWCFPQVHPEHWRWLDHQRPAFAGLDTELLAALVSPRRWIPDFLTPRSNGAESAAAADQSIRDDLQAVRATPPRSVTADIAAAYQGHPIPAVLRDGDPESLAERAADALAAYWHTCMRPSWPRIDAILRADIAQRAQRIAIGGIRGLFDNLDPRLRWADGVLSIDDPTLPPASIDVAGQGLTLAPTLFQRFPGTNLDAGLPPIVFYPARGRARLSASTDPPTPEPLTEILGASRARLLIRLELPATTTQLAAELDVTPAAVSQHLSALHRVGLLHRTRTGRHVWYSRSRLGTQLADRPVSY